MSKRKTIASVEADRDKNWVRKEEVLRVARQYAEEHGWCSVVDSALDDLGIEKPSYTVKVLVELEFRGYTGPATQDAVEDTLDLSDATVGDYDSGKSDLWTHDFREVKFEKED